MALAMARALDERRKQKKLVRRLREQLQVKFKRTETLPMDLFRAFQKFDTDQSGVIDFDEFVHVCDNVGLGQGTLDNGEMRLLFKQADKDQSGSVDFAEFLKVVVGNLVNL